MAFFFLNIGLYGQVFKINEIQEAVVEYQQFFPKVKPVLIFRRELKNYFFLNKIF